MKPMFLPGVEQNPQPGPYRALIEQMQKQGAEYPQIWHLFAFSTRGVRNYAEVEFRVGDAFVFGAETKGLPAPLLEEFAPEARLRLPMLAGNRSLNLSNTVAVVVFEAWRQIGFLGSA